MHSIALALVSLALSVVVLGTVSCEWRRLRRFPRLADPVTASRQGPLVSVLIPVRNEERNIRRCLAAVLAQRYPHLEVIVLDDGSTDGTRAILDEFAADERLEVIEGRPVPPGWTGKCNACQQLGDAARGEWLLFLDADVWAGPGLVDALLADATGRQLDLVSAFPFMELGTFWERAVLPQFIACITAFFPFERMERRDARPEDVLVNGQCLFVRRTTYSGMGGHGAVHGEVLEDVYFARAVRAAGYTVGLCDGSRHLSVRMYRSGREVAEGLMKNAPGGIRAIGIRCPWAVLRLAALSFGPAAIIIVGIGAVRGGDGRLAVWVALGLGLLATSACLMFYGALYRVHYRQPALYAILWPFGLGSYFLITAAGLWRFRTGRGVVWKGRSYGR